MEAQSIVKEFWVSRNDIMSVVSTNARFWNAPGIELLWSSTGGGISELDWSAQQEVDVYGPARSKDRKRDELSRKTGPWTN